MEIRPHQMEALDYFLDGLKSGRRRMLMVMPAGSGKSSLLAEICRIYLDARKAANILIITENQLSLESINHTLRQALSEEINATTENYLSSEDLSRSRISIVSVNSIYPSFPTSSLKKGTLVVSYEINYSSKRNTYIRDYLHRIVDESDLTLITTAAYLGDKEEEYYDKPAFRLEQDDLIRDGTLLPVTINHITPRVTSKDSEEHLSKKLRIFSKSFPPDGKAIVYCSNTRQAELASAILKSHSQHIYPVIITSKEIDLPQKISQFRNSEKYNIAINLSMLSSGYEDPQITDVVLLKRLTNRQDFGHSVANIQIASEGKQQATIWDYADNKLLDKLFASAQNNHLEADLLYLREPDLEPEAIERLEPDRRSQNTLKQLLANPVDDKPAKQDLLGRSRLVHILKGIIDRDAKKHMTLALFGKWGSGKSSVIEMLAERYREDSQCTMVVFNAWQNEHSQNMTASIAERLVNELYESKGVVDQILLSFRKKVLLDRNTVRINLIFMAVITAGIIAYFATTKFSLLSWENAGVSLLYIIGLALPLIKSYADNPFTSKLRELAKRPDFSSQIGFNHGVRSQLNALLKSYASSWPRKKTTDDHHKFVVVIDDLDRCSDDKIIQVLEAVQLVVDLDNVVVIIAVDSEILLQAVASRYLKQHRELNRSEARKTARDYLGKILQATISLDKPSSSQRQEFIAGRLYPNSTLYGAAETTIPSNPKSFLDNKPAQESETFQFSLAALADIDDEGEEAYEESSDYLHSDPFEVELFSKCVGTFDIHNARTMIRIHNAITLSKGLHPNLNEDRARLKLYIFLIFWYEAVSAASAQERFSYQAVLAGVQPDSTDPYWEKLIDLAQEIGTPEKEQQQLHKALLHIINISLPNVEIEQINELTPKAEKAEA